MTHRRIIAFVWLLFGTAGLAFSVIEFARLMRLGLPLGSGGVVATLIMFGFCILVTVAALGLFRSHGWARVTVLIAAVLLALYCLNFLAMVGFAFGAVAFIVSCLGLGFTAYTIALFRTSRV